MDPAVHGLKEHAPAVPGDLGVRIQQRLERSIQSLEDPDLQPAWVVHEVRKDLKRVRALLRLAEERLPTRKAEKRCAAAARRLSELRDADAALETLARLRRRSDAAPATVPLDEFSVLLGYRRDTLDPGLPRDVAAKLAAELAEVSRGLAALPFDSLSDQALDAGLARARQRSAKAWCGLASRPRADRFHRLRKAVKRELYQAELGGQAVERMDRATLRKLGALLGELQDLEVLRGMLKAEDRWSGSLKRLVRTARAELEGRTLRIAGGRYGTLAG